MADLVFSKKDKKLSWAEYGKTWQATSGTPSGEHIIVNDEYNAPNNSLMVGTEHIAGVPYDEKYSADSYKDKNGFGWFFYIRKGSVDGNLGIHPEGGLAGTAGCIGIVDKDTRELFNLFKIVTMTKILTIKVVD